MDRRSNRSSRSPYPRRRRHLRPQQFPRPLERPEQRGRLERPPERLVLAEPVVLPEHRERLEPLVQPVPRERLERPAAPRPLRDRVIDCRREPPGPRLGGSRLSLEGRGR